MEHVEVRVRERIDSRWSEWLDGLAISYTEAGDTLLTGPISDQAALYGLLTKLRDLGLSLSSVTLSSDRRPGNAGLWRPEQA